MSASQYCSASIGCIRGLLLFFAIAFSFSCASSRDLEPERSGDFVRHRGPQPSADEPYCAWFTSRSDDTLYFGISAFWPLYFASGGDARADLALDGPRWIGRFDLSRETLLDPLVLGETEGASGVWDVLPHPNGRVYFTTFFEESGSVDAATGRVWLYPERGTGLNELALGPDGSVLASRYWGSRRNPSTGEEIAGGSGSIVILEPDGRLRAELPLRAGPGLQLAPKSLAYDSSRATVWFNTDMLDAGSEQAPNPQAGGERHPTLMIDLEGHELLRIDEREIHFLDFEPDGTGHFVVAEGSRLSLVSLAPDEPAARVSTRAGILVADDFAHELDFVQELTVEGDGRIILTRWSGKVDIVDPRAPEGRQVEHLELPHYSGRGLYYAAHRHLSKDDGERVCATRCGDVSVVCGPAGRTTEATTHLAKPR